MTKVIFKRITSMTESGQSFTPPPFILPLVVEGEIVEIEHAGARIVVDHTGLTVKAALPLAASPAGNLEYNTGDVLHGSTVVQPNISAKAEFAKALKTGDAIPDGPNYGWIYCDGRGVEPFLVAPRDSGVMRWHQAMELASRHAFELPTIEQLHAMYHARDTGSLKDTIYLSASGQMGRYWSSTKDVNVHGCSEAFTIDFSRICDDRTLSSVRFVRPYTPA